MEHISLLEANNNTIKCAEIELVIHPANRCYKSKQRRTRKLP